MNRNHIVSALLFAASFVLYLGYLRRDPIGDAVGIRPAPAIAETDRWRIDERHSVAPAAAQTGMAAAPTPGDAPTGTAPAAPQSSHDQAEQVRRYALQAANAPDREDRSVAIRQLGWMNSPEAVSALELALRTDKDASNRMLAIRSLLALARREDGDLNIQAILQAAASDTDKRIAAYANAAYRQSLLRSDAAR